MPISLEIFCPSMGNEREAVDSWTQTWTLERPTTIDATEEGDHAGFITKCQEFLEDSRADVLAYFHSDLIIHEKGWDEKVLAQFADERIAVAGLVGAKILGHPDIYKVPYDYTQLARADVYSNLDDAEVHGRRSVEAFDIAVVDSCGVFVRREFLLGIGGWPKPPFPDNPHCTDLYVCLAAHRGKRRVRFVPVEATHKSGGKGEAGSKWLDERGGDLAMHRKAHEIIYKSFRDVLPVMIP